MSEKFYIVSRKPGSETFYLQGNPLFGDKPHWVRSQDTNHYGPSTFSRDSAEKLVAELEHEGREIRMLSADGDPRPVSKGRELWSYDEQDSHY